MDVNSKQINTIKIFFLTGSGAFGGHNRTAKTQAIEMHRRGYDVHIVTAGTDAIYSDCPFPVKKLRSSHIDKNNFNIFSVLDFHKYAQDIKPDIIHTFDLEGVFIAYWYIRSNKVCFLHTICGGKVYNHVPYPNMRPIIIFSEEQRIGLMKKLIEEENLIVCPARVDLDYSTISEDEAKRYRWEQGIDEQAIIILMICRLGENKRYALNYFLDFAEKDLLEENVHYLLVGEYQSLNIYKELKYKADQINKLRSRKIITITDKGCEDARTLWTIAKVAVGAGRTAYEAMAKGVPTLILGEYGFAGVAFGANCEKLAEFNFSGRNAKFNEPEEISAQTMAREIKNILTQKDYYGMVSKSGQVWVRKTMDVRTTGTIYEQLYSKDRIYYKDPSLKYFFKLGLFLTMRKYWRYINKKYG